MKTYALIDKGVVVNIIMWDGISPYLTDYDILPITDESHISVGWTIEGGEWSAPTVTFDDEEFAKTQAEEDAILAKQATRTAAIEKLMALGLTEEEALALAGG